MKGSRFYKLIIAILVVLNISTLAYFWMQRPPHPPKPGTHVIADEFGITGKNKTKVDKLETEHHRRKKKLMQRDRKLHVQLYKDIGKGKDPTKLHAQIAENKKEIEEMTYEYFDVIAEYCSPSKKKELREFVLNGLHRMLGGRPPKK